MQKFNLPQVASSQIPPAPNAFNLRQLAVLHYANGHTHWHFRCNTLISILATGYFLDGHDLIAAGDRMTVLAQDGCAEIVFGPDKQVYVLNKVIWS